MDGKTNIQSSQPRGVSVSHGVINGFKPLNGGQEGSARDTAGKNTSAIVKPTSSEKQGPITNNL